METIKKLKDTKDYVRFTLNKLFGIRDHDQQTYGSEGAVYEVERYVTGSRVNHTT